MSSRLRPLLDSPLLKAKATVVLLVWHALDVIIALSIGLSTGEYRLFVSLTLWTVIALTAYWIRPGVFLLASFLLAVIEETLIYSFGGGLQGRAESLLDDYAASLPVFLGFILGWYITLTRTNWSEPAIYIGAGVHGFVLEIIVSGLIFDPLAVIFLSGSAMFIYASIILAPRQPTRVEAPSVGAPGAILMWVFTLAMMVLGAVIADNLGLS